MRSFTAVMYGLAALLSSQVMPATSIAGFTPLFRRPAGGRRVDQHARSVADAELVPGVASVKRGPAYRAPRLPPMHEPATRWISP